MKTIDDIPLTREADIEKPLLDLCKSVTAKRARTVIDHILKHGIITNEDLNEIYGYDHPPRAIRDVRENGIPLITNKVTSKKTGRKIGAYTFDDISKIKKGRIGGRKAWPKGFKDSLIEKYGNRDAFTGEQLQSRYLQIDHRVPYEVAGNDAALDNLDEFMLLDASSQRAKSWSCENCENLNKLRKRNICETCFWAYPDSYSHVSMNEERRVSLSWRGEETQDYDALFSAAKSEGMKIQDFLKKLLQKSSD